ncbi:MAG: zinc ABC transporter substrate-binding protein [SAR324 cluster bacterium]|nr:zinc ABC transporter substrate-binding protein [SAR324 cluster bacterium]
MLRNIMTLFVSAIMIFAVTHSAQANLNIVATTPEIAALVREVGGDRVSVRSISKPLQDPHYVDAKPSFMVHVNRADALFFIGLELEIGWLPLLIQGARNPDLMTVELSRGIAVAGKPTGPVSRAGGDIHPQGNPHYWVDPRNGAIMAATIAETLQSLDADSAVYYGQRLAAFRETLSAKMDEWLLLLAPYKGTPIVDYHTAWVYFAAWAGLNIRNQVEAKPGIPPTPSHVQGLMTQIAQERIPLILQANYLDPKISDFLARKTGIHVLRLPATIGGEEGIASYWDFFDTVVMRIADALQNRD